MFITQVTFKDNFKRIYIRQIDEDIEAFAIFAQETVECLNVKGDFVIHKINDYKIILRNETSCPCYNELKIDGCALVEECINDVANKHNKRFTANFIKCAKQKQSCCEMLLQFI